MAHARGRRAPAGNFGDEDNDDMPMMGRATLKRQSLDILNQAVEGKANPVGGARAPAYGAGQFGGGVENSGWNNKRLDLDPPPTWNSAQPSQPALAPSSSFSRLPPKPPYTGPPPAGPPPLQARPGYGGGGGYGSGGGPAGSGSAKAVAGSKDWAITDDMMNQPWGARTLTRAPSHARRRGLGAGGRAHRNISHCVPGGCPLFSWSLFSLLLLSSVSDNGVVLRLQVPFCAP